MQRPSDATAFDCNYGSSIPPFTCQTNENRTAPLRYHGKNKQAGVFPTVIGRGDDADLRLPNILASRRHCEIDLKHSQFVLRDLESVNGTLLNGELVTEQVLQDGDQITIGASVVTVVRHSFQTKLETGIR